MHFTSDLLSLYCCQLLCCHYVVSMLLLLCRYVVSMFSLLACC
jgi:hypothetical protein